MCNTLIDPIEVFPYSIKQLKACLIDASKARPAVIEEKLQRLYFENYFDHLCAKTIIVEKEYVDRDFIEDFASYYVTCFKNYSRFCTRLHFFSSDYSNADIENLLSEENNTSPALLELKEGYLGFIVVKPLPKTIIGRTCLKTYGDGEGKRCYSTIRKYDVNLCGISFSLDSLAFQEQDQVAAACATSALWSSFHGSGHLWHHPIPSPVNITKSATSKRPEPARALPSKGLNIFQMAEAVHSVGLESHVVNVTNQQVLKPTLYAYLKAGIPVILAIGLIDSYAKPFRLMGLHAVAATGFGMEFSSPPIPDKDGFYLKASRINKLYVHDDQVGPFARMVFEDKPTDWLDENGEKQSTLCLSTSWKSPSSGGQVGSAKAFPINLLIPIYHKIRIQFDIVHDAIRTFDGVINSLRTFGLPIEELIEWDIQLSTTNTIKSEIFNNDSISDGYRSDFLKGGLPKYIWRAIAEVKDQKILELIFDATDIEQGEFFIRPIEYDLSVGFLLRKLAPVMLSWPLLESPKYIILHKILSWFGAQNES
jgi:hypothetical protein